MPELVFDPTSESFRGDPYAAYRRLRETAPVARQTNHFGGNFWILSRFRDVVSVLRDPRASVERGFPPKAPPISGDTAQDLHPLARVLRAVSRIMLFRDPPDHTRLRGLVNKAFTPRTVERLAPRIEQLVDELLVRPQADGGMDVIADLATPLPLLVIAELLGVPKEDYKSLKRWSDDLAIMLDGSVALQFAGRALPSAIQFIEYLRSVVEARRRAPQDDLLSALIATQEAGEGLTDDEILGTAMVLLAAGHETTTNLIGNGVLALLQHPGERARLVADPALLPSAVDEMLRFDPPVHATSRVLPEDLEIDGIVIPKRQEIGLLLAAANRDPEAFPDPDRFDVARRDNRHVAFGFGIHFCPGAGLARLEGRLAIAALLRLAPEMRLTTDTLQWRPGFLFRGVEKLPIAW